MDRVSFCFLGLCLLTGLAVAQVGTSTEPSLQGSTQEPDLPPQVSAEETVTGAVTDNVTDASGNDTTTPRPRPRPPRPPWVITQDMLDAQKFYEDTQHFYDYWISVVAWFCLLTNSLSFFGWCLLGKTDHVVRVILMGLAVSDILSMINIMDRSIFFWTDEDFSLQQSTDAGCRLIQYIANSARNCSSYFILGFTIDRFLSIWYPMKRRALMTMKTVAIAMTIVVVLSFAAEVYMPLELYQSSAFQRDRCLVKDSQRLSKFSSIFRNGLGFLLPALLVAILNGLIIYRIWAISAVIVRDPAESGRTRKAEAQNRALTIMLVTVSIFSFVVYLPKTIVHYMMLEGAYDYRKDVVTTFRFLSAVTIVDAIAMLNYTCNFFFYCLSVHRFRRILKKPFSYVQQSARGKRHGWDLNGSATRTAPTKYSETSTDSEITTKTKPEDKLTQF